MKAIPFFPNHPDGTHCYQAALKMVLKFFTGREYTFTDLANHTGKLEGKWTWPTTSFLWLIEEGFEIYLVEDFSYAEFARRGKDYLVEHSDQEVADAQEKHSDLPREQEIARKLVEKGMDVPWPKIPTWEDLKRLLNDGYLIICNINANQLFNQPGYSGHFVVLLEISEQDILLHDPGLPPKPFLKVKRSQFEQAWGYPNARQKNILAIKFARAG